MERENLAQKDGCSSWNSRMDEGIMQWGLQILSIAVYLLFHRKGQIWEWHLPLPDLPRKGISKEN